MSTAMDRPSALKVSIAWQDDDMVELRVIAAANGFGGDSTAYFAPREIEAFAHRLARYPLENDRSIVIKASVGHDQCVSLAVLQADALGRIAIDVELAAPSHTRPYGLYEGRLRVVTSYEDLAHFSRELLLMLEGKIDEAELPSNT